MLGLPNVKVEGLHQGEVLLFSEEPARTKTWAFLARALFSKKNTYPTFWTSFGDFWMLRK